MKRIAILLVAGIIACASVSAQTLTLTNNFGGDEDCMSKDLIAIDKDGNTAGVMINNRTQLDYSSAMIDGRIRFDWGGAKPDGKETTTRLRGYIRFRPVKQFGFAAGNDFFTKYVAKGAYMNADDDTPTIGKLAAGGFAAIVDAYGFKATANIGAKSTFADLDDNQENIKLNFGAEYTLADLLAVGATIQEVLDSDGLSIGGFISYIGTKDLTVNASFAYRASDDYTDTEMRTGASAKYTLSDAGLTFAADFLSGLSDIDSDGETNSDGIPFYAGARIVYNVSDPLQIVLKGNIAGTYSGDEMNVQIYPYIEYKTDSFGTYHAGIRFNVTKDGYDGISLPIFWQYKIKASK